MKTAISIPDELDIGGIIWEGAEEHASHEEVGLCPAAAGIESERKAVAERIEKKEFIRRLAERMQSDEETAAWWLDGVLEEMYETFRSGCGLTLPGFGGFYLDRRRESWAFKFNPGQKLRALFGWSSTYRGPL